MVLSTWFGLEAVSAWDGLVRVSETTRVLSVECALLPLFGVLSSL